MLDKNEVDVNSILSKYKDYKNISGWASKHVASLSKLAILSGNESGNFLPQNKATRAEISSIFNRLLHFTLGFFYL